MKCRTLYQHFMPLLGCTKTSTIWHIFFHYFLISPVKRRMANPQQFRRLPCREFSSFAPSANFLELLWHFDRWPTKLLSPQFRRRDTLSLPLADELALCLGDIGQHLQYQICDQGTGQTTGFLSGVQ